jgi:serine/threonine-protein kinase
LPTTVRRQLDYFCRGLRDEIVHALTSIKALAGPGARAGETRRTRRCVTRGAVITGGVRSARDRVRVTIISSTARAAFYPGPSPTDVELADPLAGQEAIAKMVADKVRLRWMPTARRRQASIGQPRRAQLVSAGPLSPQSSHRGRLHKAVSFSRKRSSRTRSFRWHTAGLPMPHGLLRPLRRARPADVWAKATSSAAAAVMLDAHSARAHLACARARDPGLGLHSAEGLFQKAIQLKPRYSTAPYWYAMSCLVPMRRLDEALEQMLLAQSLDPVSSIIARDVAVTQYYRRDFDAALEQCDHTIELNPHFAPAYLTLGLIQEQRKEFDESAAAFRRAVDLAPNSLRMQSALARTLALSGKPERAVEALHTLERLAGERYVSPVRIHDDGVCRG